MCQPSLVAIPIEQVVGSFTFGAAGSFNIEVVERIAAGGGEDGDAGLDGVASGGVPSLTP